MTRFYMSNKVVAATIVSLAAGVAYGLWQENTPPIDPPKERVPFTAIATTVSSPSFVTMMWQLALRGDGSYRETKTNFHLGTRRQSTTVTTWNTQSGRMTKRFVEAKAMSSETFDRGNFVPARCTCNQNILSLPEAGTMLGFRVVEAKKAEATKTSRTVYAPDVNCLVILFEVQMRNAKGDIVAENTYKVNQIMLGEPDPMSFQIPSDYREMAPSEAAKMQLEAVEPGSSAAGCEGLATVLKKADEKYHSSAWTE